MGSEGEYISCGCCRRRAQAKERKKKRRQERRQDRLVVPAVMVLEQTQRRGREGKGEKGREREGKGEKGRESTHVVLVKVEVACLIVIKIVDHDD